MEIINGNNQRKWENLGKRVLGLKLRVRHWEAFCEDSSRRLVPPGLVMSPRESRLSLPLISEGVPGTSRAITASLRGQPLGQAPGRKPINCLLCFKTRTRSVRGGFAECGGLGQLPEGGRSLGRPALPTISELFPCRSYINIGGFPSVPERDSSAKTVVIWAGSLAGSPSAVTRWLRSLLRAHIHAVLWVSGASWVKRCL